MLLFQIVALLQEMNGWMAAAMIGVALMAYEIWRHAPLRGGKAEDAFLRDSLDW